MAARANASADARAARFAAAVARVAPLYLTDDAEAADDYAADATADCPATLAMLNVATLATLRHAGRVANGGMAATAERADLSAALDCALALARRALADEAPGVGPLARGIVAALASDADPQAGNGASPQVCNRASPQVCNRATVAGPYLPLGRTDALPATPFSLGHAETLADTLADLAGLGGPVALVVDADPLYATEQRGHAVPVTRCSIVRNGATVVANGDVVLTAAAVDLADALAALAERCWHIDDDDAGLYREG